MPARQLLKSLSVRLPEPEIRRFKSIAAHRGVSLQEAIHEAIQTWTSERPKADRLTMEALRGSLASTDVEVLRRAEKDAEFAKDRRRT